MGVGGCGQDSVQLPSRNFDRPTDMAFTCLGLATDGEQKVRPFGQPMGACHPPGALDPGPQVVSAAGYKHRTYAFVPNAERGDLSVIDLSYCRSAESCFPPGAALVDLDTMSVGFAAAPLGELPEVLAASQDGCRVISANRGSCDLTLVNPAVLVGRYGLPAAQRQTETQLPYARTIVPRTASGRLTVAPAEVTFLPQQTFGREGDADVCDPNGVEGTTAAPVGAPAASAAAPAGWRAVVTFPSCDLVALIDLPSGDVLDSVQVVPRVENNVNLPAYTFRRMGRNPICPVSDCGATTGGGGGGSPDAASADGNDTGMNTSDAGAGGAGGAAGDGGGGGDDALAFAASPPAPAMPGLGVAPLAMHPEGRRLYFGANNYPVVGALDITGAADTFAEPAEGANTELHDGARGAMRLRLSVDPYDHSKGHDAEDATRAQYGRFVAGRHGNQPTDPLEFLYVIAKDGTVRVVHVGRPAPAECDLGIDPTDPKAGAIGPEGPERPACFPYGAADGPRRMVFAGGPGLRLGGTPQDIAFANYLTPHKFGTLAAEELDEKVLNGAFAFVMTTAGSIHILNLDPELRSTQQRVREASGVGTTWIRSAEEPRPLTHSLRDANAITYATALGPGSGPPRLAADPTAPVDGPRLMKFPTLVTRVDARIVNMGGDLSPRDAYVYFPNRATVNAQAWGIAWEGDLTGTRITGDIVSAQMTENDPVPMITTVTDNGAGFCGVGVDGDVFTLIGCDTDAGCYPGDMCVHSTRVPPNVDGRPIQGMCLHRDKVAEQRERCEPLMETFRRYEIVRNTPSAATLVPKRVEVPRPVFTTADGKRAACSPAAAQPDPHSCQPEMSTIHGAFSCMEVTARPDGSPLVRPDPAASPPVLGDVSYRCFQECVLDGECGQGRVCLTYPGLAKKVCAEGAPIDEFCGLDQLISYRIGAANAFVVGGGASGRTERVRTRAGASGPECVPDFTTSPTLVARIPVNLPECSISSAPVPADATVGARVTWDDTFLSRVAGPNPNPCYVLTSGMGDAQVLATGPQCDAKDANCTVSVLFQNNEVRFVLTDLQKPFSQTTQIRFDVNGGVAPQVVSPAVDAVPGLPARLVLGPVPAPNQTEDGVAATCLGTSGKDDPTCISGRGSEMPYMYIVDQRQIVGGRAGARGQILRVAPRISESTAPIPGVESFTASGRYFPIQ